MKLVRFTSSGQPVIGVVAGDGKGIIRISHLLPEYREMIQLAAAGPEALRRLADKAAHASPTDSLSETTLLAPMERPHKMLAIGLNYRDHAKEAVRLGVSIPPQQPWFNKATSCLSGPFDDIDPGVTSQLDYEVELGVAIGRTARYATQEDAPNHVFGYFVANDVSARDWQHHSSTWTIGKSFDTHGPIGPWIVTPDEIPDPHSLEVRCFVNGELRQRSNTDDLIYNIWAQIEYLSTAFPLEPGDLLLTGTPGGVGHAMIPQRHLQAGDVVRCEIDKIGAIENKVVPSKAKRFPTLTKGKFD
jgi:2-keto-4-pentenoate hydratase/2-oxohepta-3-ene-1,7-dioic acid hydratase in catechol pathway